MTNVALAQHPEGGFTRTAKSQRNHSKSLLVEGVLLIVLGSVAIVVPSIASFAMSIFLGWLFLISGSFSFVATIINRKRPGFWWSLLSALITAAAGAIFIELTWVGVVSITFVLAAFLILDGLVTIVLAIHRRRQFSNQWGWLFINGIVDLLFAGFIIWALPSSADWILGLIVGIDMVFGGFALIALAREMRIDAPIQS